MRRVMIYGGSGSGKSTVARRIGEITGLPVVHIDPMYWKPDWVQRSKAETLALVEAAMAEEAWVFDGNHHGTFPERLKRADHLVLLDYPTAVRLWRVIWRTLMHLGRTRADMGEGCPERFDREFIFKWVGGYRRRSYARDLQIIREAPVHLKCYHVRGARDLRQLYRDAAKYG